MGKVGRFACILVPMLCTMASLLCAIILFLAGSNKNLTGLHSYYQLQLNTENFVIPDGVSVIPTTRLGKFEPLLKTNVKKQDVKIDDFYNSYMWNYCSGDISEDDDIKTYKLKKCSPSQASYVLYLKKIVDEQSNSTIEFPDAVNKVQKTLTIVFKFMVSCYTLGLIATIVTFIIGWFGLFSRWGSCITTIFADIAFCFFFIASCCSTAISYSVRVAFNKAFKDFKVEASIGRNWLLTTWVCTAFAFGAALFWLMSTCCCSGRTSKIMSEKHPRSVKVEHTPYTYERVASPYTGSSQGPMGHYENQKGMEPMRHAHV